MRRTMEIMAAADPDLDEAGRAAVCLEALLAERDEALASSFWYYARKYGEADRFKGRELSDAEMRAHVAKWRMRAEQEAEAAGGLRIHRKYTAGFSASSFA